MGRRDSRHHGLALAQRGRHSPLVSPLVDPQRLLAFQARYEALARPFQWEFTRADLANMLKKLPTSPTTLPRAA